MLVNFKELGLVLLKLKFLGGNIKENYKEVSIMTGKVIKISEMPPGKTFEDYPEDTIFVLDEEDEDGWDKYNELEPLNQK